MEVAVVQKNNGQYLYQYAYIDKTTGNPKLGSYFYENETVDITKLGFDVEGRVKVRVKLNSGSNFLESKAADIEDWVPNSSKVFSGGETQLFNPNASYTEITVLN